VLDIGATRAQLVRSAVAGENLARADRCLCEAKNDGRNRVSPTPNFSRR